MPIVASSIVPSFTCNNYKYNETPNFIVYAPPYTF